MKHKYKKTCFQLVEAIERECGIVKGDIVKVKIGRWLINHTLNGIPIAFFVKINSYLLFMDVIYFHGYYVIRFLADGMVGHLIHENGKTMKIINKCMEKK